MTRLPFIASAVVLSLALLSGAATAPPAASARAPGQPAEPTAWLCKPGAPDNPCNQDLDGSPQRPEVSGSFAMRYPWGQAAPLDAVRPSDGRAERFAGPDRPEVDCFYAYPTVDTLGMNFARVPEEQVMAVLLAQAARFSANCRLFVPVYRQATLVEHMLGVKQTALARGEADIANAWREYWNHDNIDPRTHRRRGVVILGHSQGATALTAMMRREIDAEPDVRRHLVSAVLLGGDVTTASFRHLPACRRTGPRAPVPTGCVVAYSSYAEPPGPGDQFGHATSPDRVLCVNPAALLNGAPHDSRRRLDTYLPTRRTLNGHALGPKGSLGIILHGIPVPEADAGYVHYPQALEGQCRLAKNGDRTTSWLDITGDTAAVTEPGVRSILSGLHVIDFNVAQGDLTRLVQAQSKAWASPPG